MSRVNNGKYTQEVQVDQTNCPLLGSKKSLKTWIIHFILKTCHFVWLAGLPGQYHQTITYPTLRGKAGETSDIR